MGRGVRAGHIGGLASGFLLGFVLFVKPQFSWLYRDHVVEPALPYMHVQPPKVRKHKTYQYVLQVSRRQQARAAVGFHLTMQEKHSERGSRHTQ